MQAESLEVLEKASLAPAQALQGVRGLAGMLRAVRGWVAQAEAEGHDWRDVMASLRGCTPDLWQRLSLNERRQILRHLQPWWDTHRHRLAPGIHGRLQASLRAGQVELHAGRLQSVIRRDDGLLDVAWRPRSAPSGALAHRRVAAIVNCTGPESDIARAGEPLLDALLAAGAIRQDALRIGIDVDDECRAIGANGAASETLSVIGPVTRGRFWESVAVPDIRTQAVRVAARICA